MKTKALTGLFTFGMLFILSCTSSTQDNTEQKNVKNIIFMIGDGMGLNHMYAAMTANGGTLALEEITHVGLQKTYSANSYITDSGASGTAMACGTKTNNGSIGVDPDQNELESILKVAEKNGLATGLISTSAITHATPAAFIANDTSRNNYEAIAEDFLLTDIDLFIGGGENNFNKREDGRDLTAELEKNGYTVTRNMEELAAVTGGKLAAFTNAGHNPRATEGRGDMLPVATKKALDILSQSDKGFFMMIEGSQIDWGGHDNDQDYVVTETLDFDKAIKVVLDFAKLDGETLVVITADHETGGMIVLKGDYDTGTVKTTFTTGGHTGQPIPVYSYGPHAELFTGIFENTGFKERFMKAWGIEAE